VAVRVALTGTCTSAIVACVNVIVAGFTPPFDVLNPLQPGAALTV
jgi:hypothetical protein